jgi:hypothetical protein
MQYAQVHLALSLGYILPTCTKADYVYKVRALAIPLDSRKAPAYGVCIAIYNSNAVQ